MVCLCSFLSCFGPFTSAAPAWESSIVNFSKVVLNLDGKAIFHRTARFIQKDGNLMPRMTSIYGTLKKLRIHHEMEYGASPLFRLQWLQPSRGPGNPGNPGNPGDPGDPTHWLVPLRRMPSQWPLGSPRAWRHLRGLAAMAPSLLCHNLPKNMLLEWRIITRSRWHWRLQILWEDWQKATRPLESHLTNKTFPISSPKVHLACVQTWACRKPEKIPQINRILIWQQTSPAGIIPLPIM
jgi:hypothetical protein